MNREPFYKTIPDSTLTKQQKLEIVKAVKRGVAVMRSRLIELPETVLPTLENAGIFTQTYRYNRRFLNVWANLTMGDIQPKFVFRTERLLEIYTLSLEIAEETGEPPENIESDLLQMMKHFIGFEVR